MIGPLRREGYLGHGCDRPADHDARQPGVEQADPLHVRARQERPECAAENIGRAKQQHELDAGRAAELPGRRFGSWRYSRNQTAILTPLTSVNRPHHRATGFDQARESSIAPRHSKLIDRSRV